MGALAGAFFGLTGTTVGSVVGAVIAFLFVWDPTGISAGVDGGPFVYLAVIFIFSILFKILT